MHFKTLAVFLLAIFFAACSPGDGSNATAPTAVPDNETITITGQVLVDDAAAVLPAGSTITIQVADTSLADAAAVVLGEQIIPEATTLPVNFAIDVATVALEDAAQTTVSARVENADGELIFINDTAHLVTTEETAVNVVVTAVDPAPDTAPNALIDQTWQWVAFEDMASGAEDGSFTVDNPGQYTLTLLADGVYQVQADCNSASGSYTLTGSSLTLEPGPMTLAACGADSLSETFVTRLMDVATFVFDAEGNLVLNLKLDAGNLRFTRGS